MSQVESDESHFSSLSLFYEVIYKIIFNARPAYQNLDRDEQLWLKRSHVNDIKTEFFFILLFYLIKVTLAHLDNSTPSHIYW